MSAPPPLLALDTSTLTARVALIAPSGDVLAHAEHTAARHSASLLALCDRVFAAVGVRPAELSALACGAGPGSFTGLRVGLAVAKGLALPTARPLVLVSSLRALALDLAAMGPAAAHLVPVLDAGKGEVYAQVFRGEEAVTDELRLAPDALAAHVPGPARIGGAGYDRYRAVLDVALTASERISDAPGPSAVAVGRLAFARLARGEADDLASAVPSYGRPPDITRPKTAT